MKATILYGPRDVRVAERPEPKILKPTDAEEFGYPFVRTLFSKGK
jgi:hypothetical protein